MDKWTISVTRPSKKVNGPSLDCHTSQTSQISTLHLHLNPTIIIIIIMQQRKRDSQVRYAPVNYWSSYLFIPTCLSVRMVHTGSCCFSPQHKTRTDLSMPITCHYVTVRAAKCGGCVSRFNSFTRDSVTVHDKQRKHGKLLGELAGI